MNEKYSNGKFPQGKKREGGSESNNFFPRKSLIGEINRVVGEL